MVIIEGRRVFPADFITICSVIVALGLFWAPSLCHAAPSPSPGNVSCSTWAPNSVHNVMVDGFARFGTAEGCGAELINVSVTFFALPQSTIVLDGWSTRGGYVAIQGPPNAPWSIRDVSVVVTNSVIEASGGPAVGVVLGAAYDTSAASVGGVVLRNVKLYCSGSRLWSSISASNGQTASAANVLSVTFASTLDSVSPNVTIDYFTAVAVGCDLRSEVTATLSAFTAAVAGVAAARYGANGGGTPAWMTVSNSALYVLRSNATAVVFPSAAGILLTEVAAVSAVAGLAFGKLSSVGLTVTSTAAAVVNSRVESSVLIGSRGTVLVGSSVVGIAVGWAYSVGQAQPYSPITVANSTTFYLGWSNASSSSSSGTTSTSNSAASSIAGVAVGQALSPITVANSSTFYVGWSNVTSISTSTSTNANSFAASSVAGVTVAQAQSSPVAIANSTTFYVGWSNATSSSYSKYNSFAASSVAGVAVGYSYSNSPVTIANSATFHVGWCNVSSTSYSASTSSNAFAASSVAGVTVGHANSYSRVTIANGISLSVNRSDATAGSTCISTGNYYSRAASSVAGVAVGWCYPNSPVMIADSATFFVGWSNCASSSLSTTTGTYDAYAGSSVAGVAVGLVLSSSPVTIANSTTFFVGWSNATSTSTSASTSTGPYSTNKAFTGSSVAGVAMSQAGYDCPVTIAKDTTFYLGWSSATSTSSSTSDRKVDAYAGSSVCGVAPAPTVLLALNVTSASAVSACSMGLTSAAVSCTMVPLSSPSAQPLCCTASSAPNEAFPLLQPPVPTDGAAGGSSLGPLPQVAWPLTQGAGRRHTTTALVEPSGETASPSVSIFTVSSNSPALRSITTDGHRDDATKGRQPFLSSTLSGHRSETPTRVGTSSKAAFPSPNPVRHGGVQGLGLGLDPTVVTVVVASGYGSTAVAAALSSTSGNKASATARLVSGAECTVFGGQDLSSFPQPDDWALLPGLIILSSVSLGSDADGDATAAASKVLMTVVLILTVWAANAVWLAYRCGSMPNSSRP